MKITVFTSNQSRHIALINSLASISEKTYAVMECNTVFPGKVQDFFKKSEVMQTYFSNVINAETKLFGNICFSPSNAKILAIKGGDLNLLEQAQLQEALNSDVYVVFGSSFIKGWLIDFLVARKALNIHMGLSPYYRGSSCNFWALYDNKPHLVGATVHYLSKGLDSGPMLYHAVPKFKGESPFEFTMKAVVAAHNSLTDRISSKEIFQFEPVIQDKSFEVRYTRNTDFTDEVAKNFLERKLTIEDLSISLNSKPTFNLLRPYSQ
jgi:hypothetical protein